MLVLAIEFSKVILDTCTAQDAQEWCPSSVHIVVRTGPFTLAPNISDASLLPSLGEVFGMFPEPCS